MRKSIYLGAAAALALSLWTSAQAQTVFATGDFGAGEQLSGSGGLYLGPGSYRFSFTTSVPLDGLYGYVEKSSIWNEYCDEGEGAGEFYCGGDDVPTQPLFEQVSPTLYQLRMTVNPFVETFTPDQFVVRTVEFDLCCTYSFDLYAAGAGSYSISYAAIPEPASWALLILGFGAVGAALRRRPAVRFATS